MEESIATYEHLKSYSHITCFARIQFFIRAKILSKIELKSKGIGGCMYVRAVLWIVYNNQHKFEK